ncbi:MAG: urea transport system ATP-binding protein [Chloroflexota bacterium]|nr:urea transport system ATP-binding protein [Chloroflexota bacterium]
MAIATSAPVSDLAVENVTAGYGQSVVLHNVSLTVEPGQSVCLMGRNGVGKTTLLKTIMGLIPIRSGRVTLSDADLSRVPAHARARSGLGYVPQGRGIFPYLTVRENLLMGFETQRGGMDVLPEIYELFPILQTMGERAAGRLSGGQQQQLAIARALVGRPQVLLLDEPTEGIQPSVIWEIEHIIDTLRARGGVGILLVEQFVEFAVGVSDRYYLMEKGVMVAQGSSADLTEDTVREYLAV